MVKYFHITGKNSLCFCGMLLYRKILNIMHVKREVIALGLIVLYFLPVTFFDHRQKIFWRNCLIFSILRQLRLIFVFRRTKMCMKANVNSFATDLLNLHEFQFKDDSNCRWLCVKYRYRSPFLYDYHIILSRSTTLTV